MKIIPTLVLVLIPFNFLYAQSDWSTQYYCNKAHQAMLNAQAYQQQLDLSNKHHLNGYLHHKAKNSHDSEFHANQLGHIHALKKAHAKEVKSFRQEYKKACKHRPSLAQGFHT